MVRCEIKQTPFFPSSIWSWPLSHTRWHGSLFCHCAGLVSVIILLRAPGCISVNVEGTTEDILVLGSYILPSLLRHVPCAFGVEVVCRCASWSWASHGHLLLSEFGASFGMKWTLDALTCSLPWGKLVFQAQYWIFLSQNICLSWQTVAAGINPACQLDFMWHGS